MEKPEQYILAVGDAGASRLDLLNEIYNPGTEHFLQAHIKPGMNILEVGCGTGHISCWLADQVGKTGSVVGTDISREQLLLAQQRADAQHLTQIKFIPCSIYELDKLSLTFDLIFSRLVLVHLDEPEKALQSMYAVLKPQGILACEEQVLSRSLCFPETTAFTNANQLLRKVITKKALDYDFGLKLYPLFKQLSFNAVGMAASQPALISHRQKTLWPLFFQEASAQLLASQLINEHQLNGLINDLVNIAKNEACYILPMQNMQVWGKK